MKLTPGAIIFFITCFGVSVSSAQENKMDYKIALDNQVFSIAVPTPPDKEFMTYHPALSLQDDTLFKKSKSVVGLRLQWTYHTGLFHKVAGELETQVILQVAENNVMSDERLKKELLEHFKRELSKIGYKGDPIDFESVQINGHAWLRYQVPVMGGIEYSTGLTDKIFLTVQFATTDNTGEASPEWLHDAEMLMKQLVESMQLQ